MSTYGQCVMQEVPEDVINKLKKEIETEKDKKPDFIAEIESIISDYLMFKAAAENDKKPADETGRLSDIEKSMETALRLLKGAGDKTRVIMSQHIFMEEPRQDYRNIIENTIEGMERILSACKPTSDDLKQSKNRPKKAYRNPLINELAKAYRKHLGKDPTSSPEALFDRIVDIALCALGDSVKDQKEIIEKALLYGRAI